jgi:hypothetical protein
VRPKIRYEAFDMANEAAVASVIAEHIELVYYRCDRSTKKNQKKNRSNK